MMENLTAQQVRDVIEGRGCTQIPVLYDLWIYPSVMEKEQAQVEAMLGGIGGTLKTVGGGTLEHVNGSLAPVDANGDPVDLSDKAIIGSAGTTKLYTGGLETSNVDLATEISEMITTQRGYQANTRIVTVTDSMLEELVNMKR